MARIGDIVTQDQLQSLQRYTALSASKQGYVAPTVYRLASSKRTSWNYFNTLAAAQQFINYLAKVPGAKLPAPAGSVTFKKTDTAQTLGINVDFFNQTKWFGTIPVPYAFVKEQFKKGNVIIPFKFYKTNGAGPYYSVLSTSDLAITATNIGKVPADKIEHLDRLSREIALLRANYNTLATYLNNLAKRKLNKTEQQIFNEGMLRLQEYKDDIRNIKDIDFVFGKSGQISGIGILPVIAWVVIWVVSALLVTYSITKIAAKWAEVQKIRSDNDTITFITEANYKIAADPNLTVEQKKEMIAQNNKTIDQAEKHKEVVEENADKPDMMSQLISLAKWGLIFYGIKIIGETVGKKMSK